MNPKLELGTWSKLLCCCNQCKPIRFVQVVSRLLQMHLSNRSKCLKQPILHFLNAVRNANILRSWRASTALGQEAGHRHILLSNADSLGCKWQCSSNVGLPESLLFKSFQSSLSTRNHIELSICIFIHTCISVCIYIYICVTITYIHVFKIPLTPQAQVPIWAR